MADAMQNANELGAVGDDLHRLMADLYPICRSLTGNGVRETLKIIKRLVPLEIHEVASGRKVFDWTVPKEWNIADGYVKNSKGERVIDFQRTNLHVMSYSIPVRAKMGLQELKTHLYSLPEYPDWIPHKTTYYREDWGFSLSHKQLCQLEEDEYDVCIDASLVEGHLTYGEYYLKGERSDEILISCHVCHPSLCNDNLSGIAIASFLAKALTGRKLRYSYRFLFIPGQIGSITWLALNEATVSRIKHGLVLVGLGDAGHSTYKKSRRGNAEIDRAAIQVLKDSGEPFDVEEFVPYGYDERQYCSPGFDLPVGCLMRTPHGKFREYHTSADNLDFVKPFALADSLTKSLKMLALLEANRTYVSLNQKCEPRLGPRGLYRTVGGHPGGGVIKELPALWVLNMSDGRHSLLDISERSGLPFDLISRAAEALVECHLLEEVTARTDASTEGAKATS